MDRGRISSGELRLQEIDYQEDLSQLQDPEHIDEVDYSSFSELPEAEQVLIFRYDEIGLRGDGAFEDAVIVGIFLYDAQGFSRADMIAKGE